MDCSTPGFSVLHHLPEIAQAPVLWVGDAIQPSHPLLSPPLLPSIFPSISLFIINKLFESGGQSIGASVSVLPMNIQIWFPLGLTNLISLPSTGLSRVFSSTTVQKHQFFGCSVLFMVQLSYPYLSTGKNIALTIWTFVDKAMSLLFNMLSRFLLCCLHVALRVQLQVLGNTVLLITNPMLLITLGYQAEPNVFVVFLLAYSQWAC